MANENEKQLEQLLSDVEELKSRFDSRERGAYTLAARQQVYLDAGKAPEQITHGMLCEGFQSISGIPDEFMSAEDPADRRKLWKERMQERARNYRSRCGCGGSCSSCDPTYKD